jgi:hypothetical protein
VVGVRRSPVQAAQGAETPGGVKQKALGQTTELATD